MFLIKKYLLKLTSLIKPSFLSLLFLNLTVGQLHALASLFHRSDKPTEPARLNASGATVTTETTAAVSLTSAPHPGEHRARAVSGTGARPVSMAKPGEAAASGSPAGASSTGAEGSLLSVFGSFGKSRSEGDLPSLLARTVGRVDQQAQELISLREAQAGQAQELGSLRETQAAHTEAFGKINTLLEQDDRRIRALDGVPAQLAELTSMVKNDTELRELRGRETVRDSLKISVETVAHGSCCTDYIRVSPNSLRALKVRDAEKESQFDSALRAAQAAAAQDNRHAGDKKLFEDTAIGDAAAAVGAQAERVAEGFTWPRALAAAGAVTLAVYLARHHVKVNTSELKLAVRPK